MGLYSRLKSFLNVSFGGPGANTYQSAQDWLAGLPVGSVSGILAPYRDHPTACTAISTIAEDAASIAWDLYTDEGDPDDDKIETHPLYDLWKRPNATMTGSDLWVASYTYYLLNGECFWYYPGLRVGRTDGMKANRRSTGQINLLDPARVTVKDIETYLYRLPNGDDQPLDVKYLTHFKRFNPYNPLRGLSKLDALMLELNVDWSAANWTRSYFGDQNGVPTGLIRPPVGSVVNPIDREDFLKNFNSRHRNKRGVGIVPPGYEWIDVGSSPSDMEFKDLREFSREQILAVYGLPPFRAGVLDKANYANARAQDGVYWNGTITRQLTYFQCVINEDFLPKVGVEGVEAWPDFESVKALTEDLSEKATIATALFALGFPKRMINDRLDLGMPVDDLEDADVGYLPISFIPVDMVEDKFDAANEAARMPPVAPPGANGEDKPAPNGEEKPPAKGFRPVLAYTRASGRRENVWRSISHRTRDLEARFEKVIRKHFRDIETEVLKVMGGLKGWNLVQGVESITKTDQSGLFDMQYAKGVLRRMVAPLYEAAVSRGGTSVMSEIGADVAFDILSPNVSSKLAELTGKITRIDDTVERLLRESLIEGLQAGEGTSQLTVRIREVMDASRARAATIARTETGSAFSSGRVEGMRQAGVSKQEWLTAHDEHVRDAHVKLDGEVRALDEAFSNGLRYPNDSSGPPEEIINCFVPSTTVQGAFVAGSRFKYVGPVVEIATASGNRLTVTPNHPVLTSHGFAPAGTLHDGDYVLSHSTDREGLHGPDYDQNAPASIEKVFHALYVGAGRSTCEVVQPKQFHGDALFGEGDVEVVVPNRELLLDAKTESAEVFGQGVLVGAAVSEACVTSSGPGNASRHGVGRSTASLPSGLALSSDLLGVLTDGIPLDPLRLGAASYSDSTLSKEAKEWGPAGAAFARELLEAHPGLVTLDQVVGVVEHEFSGHVYDLQSVNGWMVAENIVTSNCRCAVVPVIGEANV